MHRAARPWSAKIGDNTAVVQEDRDFPLRSTLDKGAIHPPDRLRLLGRSEEHTSELQSLMRISYAVFCLKKKKTTTYTTKNKNHHVKEDYIDIIRTKHDDNN